MHISLFQSADHALSGNDAESELIAWLQTEHNRRIGSLGKHEILDDGHRIFVPALNTFYWVSGDGIREEKQL